MSDDNKFFRWVWRLNGLLLVLLLGGGLIGGAYFFWESYLINHYVEAHYANVVKPNLNAPVYALETADKTLPFLTGAPERLYALAERVAYDPDKRTVHNILALNDEAKTSHWLFAPGKQVILDSEMLYQFPSGKRDEAVAGYRLPGMALVVAEADTNKDGAVDEHDHQALYFYHLDGKPPVKILSGDRILLDAPGFPNLNLHVFYQDGGKSFALTYSIPDLTVTAKISVSGLPNLATPGKNGPVKIGFVGTTQISD